MESGAPGTILLTGATGYIGGRLLPLLLAMGRRMRLLVRDRTRLRGIDTAGAEVVT